MSRHRRRDSGQHEDYGQTWEVASFLSDGPRTKEEVTEHFHSYLRWLGMFNVTARLGDADKHARLMDSVQGALDDLLTRGWAVREGERYALTDLGRAEAAKPLAPALSRITSLHVLLSLAVSVLLASLPEATAGSPERTPHDEARLLGPSSPFTICPACGAGDPTHREDRRR